MRLIRKVFFVVLWSIAIPVLFVGLMGFTLAILESAGKIADKKQFEHIVAVIDLAAILPISFILGIVGYLPGTKRTVKSDATSNESKSGDLHKKGEESDKLSSSLTFSIGKTVGIFSVSYLGLLILIGLLLQKAKTSTSGIGLNTLALFFASLVASTVFIRRNGRLFTNSEADSLVYLSLAASILMETVISLAIPSVRAVGAGVLVAIMAFVGLVNYFILSRCYRRWVRSLFARHYPEED